MLLPRQAWEPRPTPDHWSRCYSARRLYFSAAAWPTVEDCDAATTEATAHGTAVQAAAGHVRYFGLGAISEPPLGDGNGCEPSRS